MAANIPNFKCGYATLAWNIDASRKANKRDRGETLEERRRQREMLKDWSVGILEYWVNCESQFSTTPSLRYSNFL
jgi:hypothetical protein